MLTQNRTESYRAVLFLKRRHSRCRFVTEIVPIPIGLVERI